MSWKAGRIAAGRSPSLGANKCYTGGTPARHLEAPLPRAAPAPYPELNAVLDELATGAQAALGASFVGA